MKWLSFLVVGIAGISMMFQAVVVIGAEIPAEIESISHAIETDTNEKISFKLSDAVVPKLFVLRGEKPRLVIDFPEATYKGQMLITLPDGDLATAIRAGLHIDPVQKTRVVVDLSKETVVQFSHDYSEQEKTLIVTLSPEGATKVRPIAQPVASPEPKEQQAQTPTPLPAEEPAELPLNGKQIPPVFSVKEMAEPAAKDKAVASIGSPQLLDISFDNSSNRGEMVLFHLNDFYPPTVSAIEKENPRVLCDFMEMSLVKGVKENIFANGKFVERIRTARHKNPNKVRVVLDLSPDRDYDLQQVFFKNDNLFVLIVNELSEKVAQ